MLRNESIEEFIKRIEPLNKKDQFSMFEPDEVDLFNKLKKSSHIHTELLQKLKENGFSEFKIGIAIAMDNIHSRFIVLEPKWS